MSGSRIAWHRLQHLRICAREGRRDDVFRSRPITAYAGGISLGFQPPEQLAAEARALVEKGYRAIKLRVGDNWRDDVARVRAVRAELGASVDSLVDANTNYTVADVRQAMPAYDGWEWGGLSRFSVNGGVLHGPAGLSLAVEKLSGCAAEPSWTVCLRQI